MPPSHPLDCGTPSTAPIKATTLKEPAPTAADLPEESAEFVDTPAQDLVPSEEDAEDTAPDVIDPQPIIPLEAHHIGIERPPAFSLDELNRYAFHEIARSGFSGVATYEDALSAVGGKLAEGLRGQLILNIGGKDVMLEENEHGQIGYHYPFSASVDVMMSTFLRRTYKRLPPELQMEGDLNGAAGKALARFTRRATGVVYDLAGTETYFNRRTEQYIKAPCPPRALTPRYDRQIARWLKLLSGDKHDKLLDWLATFTDLTKPTCAPYFYGASRAGKSVLALGLNRNWTTDKKPTPLWRYFDTFNNDVIKSGILFADEQLSRDRVKFNTEDLRDLITAEAHDIFTKRLDSARALGCFRVMLASNSSNMLDLDVRGLDPHSLVAVGLRFLPIEVPTAAADYLRSIGGRAGTERWVEGDLIIRHALWLRHSRKVKPGVNGLLVEGDLPSSRDLLVATGPADAILGFLTDLLSGNPLPVGLDANTIFSGDGKIYVVMDKLRIYFDKSMKKPYFRKTLSNALVNLQRQGTPENFRPRVWTSRENLQIQPRVFDIDPQHLHNYMQQTKSGDPDKVKEALAASEIRGNGQFAGITGATGH